MGYSELKLHPERVFDSDPARLRVGMELYGKVADLPLVCPHGHVDPRLFADREMTLGSPADMFIIPGCGHSPFREYPSETLKAITDFLEKHHLLQPG